MSSYTKETAAMQSLHEHFSCPCWLLHFQVLCLRCCPALLLTFMANRSLQAGSVMLHCQQHHSMGGTLQALHQLCLLHTAGILAWQNIPCTSRLSMLPEESGAQVVTASPKGGWVVTRLFQQPLHYLHAICQSSTADAEPCICCVWSKALVMCSSLPHPCRYLHEAACL